MTYRRLTIAQTKLALAAGHKIMAAEGEAFFPSSTNVMRAPLNLPSTSVHRSAFNHLRKHGFIRINEAESRIPTTQFYDRDGNWYATWEAVPGKLTAEERAHA